MFQYTEYTGTTIASLGDVRFTDGATEVVYFNQLDERWANKPYGTDNIGGYGCGPTSMSIVVSSLTDDIVDSIEMAEWAYQNGGWCSKSGSYHSLIPNTAKAWGLTVEGCTASEPQRILDVLSSGRLVEDLASYKRSRKLLELSIISERGQKRGYSGRAILDYWVMRSSSKNIGRNKMGRLKMQSL